MVLTVYFFLCQLLQFSFKNVSSLKNLAHNKSFIDFTDLFESVKLIFRIFNFDFSLKC